MAVTILPQNPPSFGERAFQGLGSGIQQLAEMQMQNFMKQKQQGQLRQALAAGGFPQPLADLISSLPNTELQQTALKNLYQGGGGMPQTGAQGTIEQMGQAQPQAQAPTAYNMLSQPPRREVREEEKLALKKQQALQPYFKDISDKGAPASELLSTANEALNVLKTGKAFTGLKGALTPSVLQTEEGQLLDTLLNRIVILKAQQGKGLPTKTRLELEKLGKAGTWQKPKVIEKILNMTINDPEVMKNASNYQAFEDVNKQFGGEYPNNIKSLISERASELEKGLSKKQELSPKSLPPAKGKKDGTYARNPLTGKIGYTVQNGEWVPYQGSIYAQEG